MLTDYLICVAGLILLYVSAEGVVRGSARVASTLGIRPLVVGLTVVAFGTSAPEMVVSLLAAMAGKADISLGNIIGSNIANVGLVIGLAALYRWIPAGQQLLRRDMPVLMTAMIGYWVLGMNGRLGRADGIVFYTGLILFCSWCIRRALEPGWPLPAEARSNASRKAMLTRNGSLFLGGLIGLGLGGHFLVKSASSIAAALGLKEWVIGVTLVALGTSLPEIATSLVAMFRGQPELAIGNAVGSNIFNVLFVQGTVALIRPVEVPAARLEIDFPYMVGLCVLLYLILALQKGIRRWQGGLLLAAYLVYLWVSVTLVA